MRPQCTKLVASKEIQTASTYDNFIHRPWQRLATMEVHKFEKTVRCPSWLLRLSVIFQLNPASHISSVYRARAFVHAPQQQPFTEGLDPLEYLTFDTSDSRRHETCTHAILPSRHIQPVTTILKTTFHQEQKNAQTSHTQPSLNLLTAHHPAANPHPHHPQ